MSGRTWLAVSAVLVCHAVPAPAQSLERGQALFESRCVACHSLDENRVGPALRSVLGRRAGTASGYFYSEAMVSAKHVWDRPKLKAWLTNPEDVVPGQGMNYRLELPQDREDVVAYLASLSGYDAQPMPSRPPEPPKSHARNRHHRQH